MYRYLHQLLEAQNWLRGEPGVIVNTRNTIPSKQRRRIIVQKGQRCAYCTTMDSLTVDHKLARALGGTNARRNLQVLCKSCNWQKAAEEAHLLALLRTVAGRAELWHQWTQLRAEQTARSQRKRAQQGVLSENGINSTLRNLPDEQAQNSLGHLDYGGFPVAVDDDAPVAQVFIKRDFGDAQALGNLVHSKLLLAIEHLGDNGRVLTNRLKTVLPFSRLNLSN